MREKKKKKNPIFVFFRKYVNLAYIHCSKALICSLLDLGHLLVYAYQVLIKSS